MSDATPCCPTCRKPLPLESGESEPLRHRPFCSERCRMIDLGRWLDGDYSIPGPSLPGED